MTSGTLPDGSDPCRTEVAAKIARALQEQLPTGTAATPDMDPTRIARLLEKPPEAELGDFALPCFRFAKPLQRKPQDLATALAEKLNTSSGHWIARAAATGAFLNIFVNKAALAQLVLPEVLAGSYFSRLAARPEPRATKVMIEYSQPNTHKEFHIGHARNVCLGLSLVNLYRYCGYPVVAANYIGDEGTHIAKCLWHLRKTNAVPPAKGRGEWLGDIYVAATKALEGMDPESRKLADAEISTVLRGIEAHDEGEKNPIWKLWRETRQWSLDDFDRVYDWFGVKFDRVFFESEVSRDSQAIVDKFLASGVFVESDGAIGSDLKAHKLGFMIVRKRDGNTLYATKDLALAGRKFGEFGIDRSIYVVAAEQNHHFRQVFKTLELMGFEQAKKCFHLSYGMVMLPEGKMSSRDGTSVGFGALRTSITEALGTHLEKYRGEWTTAEIDAVAKELCEGAVKYGMLHTDAVKDIIFDPAAWISFEGNSGPYLMYSHARTRSILRKAAAEGLLTPINAGTSSSVFQSLTEASEHAVLRAIYDFNDVVEAACENYKPSLLSTHLFYMCKAFNRFYADQPVMKAEGDVRQARLVLTQAFAETLRRGLALLGIAAPEKM